MAMVDIRKNQSWIWWTFSTKKTVGRLQTWRIKPSENHGIVPVLKLEQLNCGTGVVVLLPGMTWEAIEAFATNKTGNHGKPTGYL